MSNLWTREKKVLEPLGKVLVLLLRFAPDAKNSCSITYTNSSAHQVHVCVCVCVCVIHIVSSRAEFPSSDIQQNTANVAV